MNPFTFYLQPGDVVLFQHNGDLGTLIQHVTHSWASHAAFCVESPRSLIEAHDLEGVRRTQIDLYLNDPEYVRIQVRRASGLSVPAAVAKALSMDGTPYGTLDLLRIYGYEHLHLSGLDVPGLDGEGHLICSELDARALYAGTVDVRPPGIHSFGLVTPAHLALTTALETVYDWRTA